MAVAQIDYDLPSGRFDLDTGGLKVSLIALQAKLLDLKRKISDSLQPAAANQVLYSTWNARLHQRELGSRGEQALQRLAKLHAHARVVITIDEALLLESDPDTALTALAKILSRDSSQAGSPT